MTSYTVDGNTNWKSLLGELVDCIHQNCKWAMFLNVCRKIVIEKKRKQQIFINREWNKQGYSYTIFLSMLLLKEWDKSVCTDIDLQDIQLSENNRQIAEQ